MAYSIDEIAKLVNGKIKGDSSLFIKMLSPFDYALEEDLTFASDEKYIKKIEETKAKVLIVPEREDLPEGKTYIMVNQSPRQLMPKLLNYFKRKTKKMEKAIEDSSKIGENVQISPNCYIGHDVEIGDGTYIYPGVSILEGTKIGTGCTIYPNVTIREFSKIGDYVIIQPGAVIGSDGFGYVTIENIHFKIEQIGSVIIEDNVEIGANVAIDRGTIGNTVIKRGTKFDNLVHIAHNVIVGQNCLIVGQVGIAGSSEIGDNCTFAGQVGVAGHIKIGNNVTIAAKSGVTNDIEPNRLVSGFPVSDHKEDLKIKVAMKKLPEMIKKIKKIEKQLEGK